MIALYPDPATYWRKDGELPTHDARYPVEEPRLWLDPHIEEQGLLSAQRIREYAMSVGMIRPFEEENLRPASYNLTLGPWCQIDGETKILTPKKPVLEIPPNTLAFVSMRQVIVLPHYIAARFNLSIKVVYRGVLLGTGPQVDPGFKGVLSCPLHNLSDETIPLTLGDHIATIDFVKTTGLGERSSARGSGAEARMPAEHLPEPLRDLQEEAAFYKANEKLNGYTPNETEMPNRLVLYRESGRWRRPIVGYQEGVKVTGSVSGLARRVGRIELAGSVGILVALATFVLGFSTVLTGFISPLQVNGQEVTSLHKAVQDQQAASRSLKLCVQALASRPQLPTAPPQPVPECAGLNSP